ncbi:MAG: pyridoxal phosphate-dependent aminotransferase [Alphaproteobacteria bacterium]|nr:pyridoxal phosphate-dependent aminotransferase [Alphaproteobacteria bacterium]
MLSKRYKEMLSQKSVIRDMFYFATERIETHGADNVFDYSIGNPSVPVPEAYNKKIKELLENPDFLEVHGYSPNLGVLSVREKIAAYLKKTYGVPYEAEHIFMTAGASSALCHAIRCVMEPGEEVVVFAPYFPEYRPYIELAGGTMRVVEADTKAFQIHFDELEKALNEKTAAVIVNSPSNPSGVVFSEETLKKLADLLHEKQKKYGHEIFIISDEPYREIVFDGKTVPYVSKYYDNTLSCYSFSKSLSVPGDRIGYLAANPACVDANMIAQMCGQISRGTGHNCPTAFIQLAIGDLIGTTADLSVYETNMNLLYDAFMSLGCECIRPDGTFYLFPKAPEPDARAFCDKAKYANLIFVPGDSFGCPGYFRVSFCKDTRTVERSIPVLKEFMHRTYGR